MQKPVRNRLHAYERVRGLCAAHRVVFEATPGARKRREALDALVNRIRALGADQMSAKLERRAATADCRRMRRALHDAARLIVSVVAVSGLGDKAAHALRQPRFASDVDLAAHMRAMLDVASKHEDTLVAEGLPPGFLDLVARQISRLERARSERTRALERFTVDTEQTHEALNAARATIEVLEGIVLHSADAPPGVLMVLRQAKRVGPRRTQPEAEVPVVDAVVVEDRLEGPPGLNDRREQAAAPEVVRFIRDFLRKKGFALTGGGVRSESIPRTDLQSAETRLRLPA